MARRNHTFEINEHYHCYNRGTDKRTIFCDAQDYRYFIKSINAYNTTETLGKLRLHKNTVTEPVVEVLAYNLLPNHFHMVIKEIVKNGTSKYLQRIGIGYTMYFNQKYKRNGGLFQGTFKSTHVLTDQDLKQVISYVAFNNIIHKIKDTSLFRSYTSKTNPIVRDLNSNNGGVSYMKEVAEIISNKRLGLE